MTPCEAGPPTLRRFPGRRFHRANMTARRRDALILIVVLLANYGCGGPVTHVTVSGLRGLRVGMSMDEVARLIGAPPHRVYSGDDAWVYQTGGLVDSMRAVRLNLTFSKGRLLYATSYRRNHIADDITDLFTLNLDGSVKEGPDLTKWFSP